METGSRDYADKNWLRELNRDESQRGVLGFLREVFGSLLGAGAVIFLVIVALGWN